LFGRCCLFPLVFATLLLCVVAKFFALAFFWRLTIYRTRFAPLVGTMILGDKAEKPVKETKEKAEKPAAKPKAEKAAADAAEKVEATKEKAVQTFGPSVPENTLVFGVCHLYASFNDTFVVSALAISRVARHTLLYRRHGTAKKNTRFFQQLVSATKHIASRNKPAKSVVI
jgi:hypothetical protein